MIDLTVNGIKLIVYDPHVYWWDEFISRDYLSFNEIAETYYSFCLKYKLLNFMTVDFYDEEVKKSLDLFRKDYIVNGIKRLIEVLLQYKNIDLNNSKNINIDCYFVLKNFSCLPLYNTNNFEPYTQEEKEEMYEDDQRGIDMFCDFKTTDSYLWYGLFEDLSIMIIKTDNNVPIIFINEKYINELDLNTINFSNKSSIDKLGTEIAFYNTNINLIKAFSYDYKNREVTFNE